MKRGKEGQIGMRMGAKEAVVGVRWHKVLLGGIMGIRVCRGVVERREL